jgi:tetratricopeptide (TPR) repeat protein
VKNFAVYFVVGLLLVSFGISATAQDTSDYDALVRQANSQLQASNNEQALSNANAAIKMNAIRWEAYAVAGGALLNLKRYEEAADQFSRAIDHAPEAKQAGLRDLRRQCLLAESGASSSPAQAPIPPSAQPSPTTQAEIVLWKTIEHSKSPTDFQAYLQQYPNGVFASLARQHLRDIQGEQLRSQEEAIRNAITVIGVEHDHDAGVGNLFTAGATIGQCYGELEIGRKMVTYKTSSSHGFSVPCSAIDDLELKSKYGKNNMVHMVVNGKNMNFFSHNDPHSAEDIIQTIRNSCDSSREVTTNLGTERSVADSPLTSTINPESTIPTIAPSPGVTIPAAAQSAILHIIRNSSTAGSIPAYIFVDQHRPLEVLNRQNVKILLPPGKHTVSVEDKDVSGSELTDLAMEAGKEYWIKLSLSASLWKPHSKLTIEPSQSAQAESAKLVEISYGDAFNK